MPHRLLPIVPVLAAMLCAPAQAADPAQGKYCVFGKGTSYDMLLVRPKTDGSLLFGLSSWTESGSNFSVAGVASQSGQGWAYRDQMRAADAGERCAVDIQLDGRGAYRLSTVEGARCENSAGHGAVLYGADVFPPGSRVADAPATFGMEMLGRIGCDRKRR